MKNLIMVYCCFSTIYATFSQPSFDAKRDFVWVFGKESGFTDSVRYKFLDFRTDTMSLHFVRTKSHDLFQTNASICDTAGNFLFFSNGCVLIDSNYQLIQGADTINRGVQWSSYCSKGSDMTFGYVIVNGCWILPVSDIKYKVFYADLINDYAHSSGIRFATVKQDYNLNQLEGFNPDTYQFYADLHGNKRGIVRHANGRDWWMINEGYDTHKYYISRIDSSEQIHPTINQTFNTLPPKIYHGGGQACFTPDGTKYVTIDARNHCQVFDFDRCKGELSNVRYIPLPVPYDSVGASTGIAVSPNSRFMYLMTLYTIWQYDLNATDIASTKIKVAQCDNWVDLYNQTLVFYQSQLGPDGKIYVFAPAGRRAFTVIENPDIEGLGCNVIQHKFYFPTQGTVSQPPRFPNFRLGPVVGSPCDTIVYSSTLANERVATRMLLRPNPANDYTVVDITVSDYSAAMGLALEVYDLSGVLLKSYLVSPYTALQRIETSDLANGLYLVSLKGKGSVLRTEKLVVLRE
jgi:Secretion system C-terminal sorting domain